MNIAVIPARGGSKRIPKKNIKFFCGKPMIAWAIDVALASNIFEKVIVSTDDEEIKQISEKAGALVPFSRPKNLADDFTPTVPVIAHAVKECLEIGFHVNYACCIYPCAPFIHKTDLTEGFRLISSEKLDFVYPVTSYAHPIQRAMRQSSNGKMQFIDSANEMLRTQDLEESYHDAGQFYWGLVDAWLKHKRMHTDGVGMVIPNWRVVDIDTTEDWKRAELIYEAFLKNV